jgi:hypothetical protein
MRMRLLRKTLADSHISAVAVAVLLVWSIEWALRALWGPLYRLVSFLFTAILILDIPYISWDATSYRNVFLISSMYLFWGLISLSAAWLLSRWVYGHGPLRSLHECHSELAGRTNA